MVDVGEVIENPVTWERITFVWSSEQTGGALAEPDLTLSPAARVRITFTPVAGIEQSFDDFLGHAPLPTRRADEHRRDSS